MENPSPNRLLESEIVTLSDDPLLGVLELDSDQGPIRLAVNRKVAEMLRETLDTFLGG